MKFEKWQALGNDYVIVEGAALPWELTPERVVRLCTPHFGIGADGILLLAAPPSGGPVAKLRVFNPDGSEAERAGASGASRTARAALGFEELLRGDVEAMKREHRRYARRQLTWMRRMEGVHLIDRTGRGDAEVASAIGAWLDAGVRA